MRALLLTFVVLGACAPDIVSGAYLCGPDEACPDGQVCNGADAICVLPGGATPFACGKVTEVEPNDGAATAQAIANLPCASTLAEIRGCTPLGDAEDWYAFDVPSTCLSTVASVRLSFALAWEGLTIQLAGPDGSFDGAASACDVISPDDGALQVCLKRPVTAGGHYTLRIGLDGTGDCDGACRYNRYTLGLQLGTP